MPLRESTIELIEASKKDVIRLSLRHQGFVDDDIKQLIPLLNHNSNIVSLELSHNNFGSIAAKALAGLKYVQFLDVSYCNVGDEGAEALALSKIKTIDLSSTSVTDDGLMYLSKHALQHYLTFADNPRISESLLSSVLAKVRANRMQDGTDFDEKAQHSARYLTELFAGKSDKDQEANIASENISRFVSSI